MATFDPVILVKNAIASGASYANEPVPLGMEVLERFESLNNTGFSATAFRDTTTGKIVFSVRGSDDMNDWMKSNPALVLQNLPDQYPEVSAIFDYVLETYAGNDKNNIVADGHSLVPCNI